MTDREHHAPTLPKRLLFPPGDHQFREAVLLAVELFEPGDTIAGASFPPRLVDDERLAAAAQAMLRAAYPMATILIDRAAAPGARATWRIDRDPEAHDRSLVEAARSGDSVSWPAVERAPRRAAELRAKTAIVVFPPRG